MAPLHQPHNVAGIIALQALLPKVSQIACFDTAFHRSQPQVAQAFGLPRALTAEAVSYTHPDAADERSSVDLGAQASPRQAVMVKHLVRLIQEGQLARVVPANVNIQPSRISRMDIDE